MFYAVKLGPIQTGEGPINAYIGFCAHGAHPPALALRDADGLRELVDASHGEELACEPPLARAGAKLGFKAAPPPEWVVEGRATVALGMVSGSLLARPGDMDMLIELAKSGAEFWKAKPWRHWSDSEPLEVAVSGALDHTFECALMGRGAQEYGIALYRKAGALGRIAAAADAGSLEASTREDALSVTFDAEPRFAVEALKAAFDVPRLPVPIKLARGRVTVTSRVELAALAIALRAMAALSPKEQQVARAAEFEGKRIEVRVSAPPPARRDRGDAARPGGRRGRRRGPAA